MSDEVDEKRCELASWPLVRSPAWILIAIHLGALALQTAMPQVDNYLELTPASLFQHGQVWRLVTAIYVFGANGLAVAWLCCFLIIFVRKLEAIYSRLDILFFYNFAGAFGGLIWAASNVWGASSKFSIGWCTTLTACAATSAIITLYFLHYPVRVLRLFRILPVPVWLLLVVYFMGDIVFFSHTPYSLPLPAHLGGVLFAMLFRQFDLRFSTFRRFFRSKTRQTPVDSNATMESRHLPEAELLEQVDSVLEKMSRHGPESLTDTDRALLKEASRRFRQHRE